jgi:predicted permease
MLSDLRDAARTLARDRAFATFAILLLSITGGATTAVYAVVDAVLLRPMAFGAPDRTVVMWEHDAARATTVVEVALGEVDSWRAQAPSLESAAVFASVNVPVALVGDSSRTRVSGTWVSASFFDVVGVPPALGRPLDSSDETGDEPRTAVVSDGFWKQHFGADAGIVGRSIRVQGGPQHPPGLIEIVGVMPPAFDFPRGADLWLPAAPALRSIARSVPGDRADTITWYLSHFKVFYGLGRLRENVTPAYAAQEIGQIMRQQQMPTGTPSDVVITPVADYLTGPTRPVLWILLGGGVLMLVLACSSVAGLHLFRAAKQDRALAIQLALGASRDRLMRRSLFESAILACLATVAGWSVAGLLMRVPVISAPVEVPRLATASVGNASVLLMTIGLAVFASALTGILPACFVGRVHPGRILTSGARTAMHPRERMIQRIVVGWQVAAAVVLLAGAALFVRSVQQLDRTPLGFDANGLVSIEIEPSAGDFERWDQFVDALLGRVKVLPQVLEASAVALRPLRGPIGYDSIPVLEGQEGLEPDAPWRRNPRANLQSVVPGYFGTISYCGSRRCRDPTARYAGAPRHW